MPGTEEIRAALCDQGWSIAIDGPAAAGKSSVAKGLGRLLGCPVLDTGLMYRAVTALALKEGIAVEDGPSLGDLARHTTFTLEDHADDTLRVNGRDMTGELHTPLIDAGVSAVSAHPEVRSVLVERQRQIAAETCAIVVGRDIGTVVLPTAPIKLWITASSRERARRRLGDYQEAASAAALAAEQEKIERRDQLDSTRPVSPLRRAPDAIVVQTDQMDERQSVACAVEHVKVAVEGFAGHSQPLSGG